MQNGKMIRMARQNIDHRRSLKAICSEIRSLIHQKSSSLVLEEKVMSHSCYTSSDVDSIHSRMHNNIAPRSQPLCCGGLRNSTWPYCHLDHHITFIERYSRLFIGKFLYECGSMLTDLATSHRARHSILDLCHKLTKGEDLMKWRT